MTTPIASDDVREACDGVEARLYELTMGELLHLGGLMSSLELLERAGIGKGSRGVDLCCGNGASMRMLVQLADVASMVGVELSEKQVERTTARTRRAGLEDRVRVIHGDACETGLPDVRWISCAAKMPGVTCRPKQRSSPRSFVSRGPAGWLHSPTGPWAKRSFLDAISGQLAFIRDLGRAGKVAQTRVIVRRTA